GGFRGQSEVVFDQRLHGGLVEAIGGAVDGLDAVLVVPHVHFGAHVQGAFFAKQRLARVPLDLDRGADRGLGVGLFGWRAPVDETVDQEALVANGEGVGTGDGQLGGVTVAVL